MSDCLHCDINDLIHEYIEKSGGVVDVAELAARLMESLAELILLAPEDDHSKVMAEALAHFGSVFLEKSGAIEGSSGATH